MKDSFFFNFCFEKVPERKIKRFLFLSAPNIVLPGYVFPTHPSFFFLIHTSLVLIFGWRVHLISQPLNGNLSSQRHSSTLQIDFPLLANWSFEAQFTGPGKGSWQDSWTVWFWSLSKLEKPPSFMLVPCTIRTQLHGSTSLFGMAVCDVPGPSRLSDL